MEYEIIMYLIGILLGSSLTSIHYIKKLDFYERAYARLQKSYTKISAQLIEKIRSDKQWNYKGIL